jgi:hypothetical protein
MRSLLIKASIMTSLVLSLGSGITLASASSKPGMFLYPVKQTTQKAIGTFSNITAVEIPIAVPSQTPEVQESAILETSSVKDIRPDTLQEPAGTEGIIADDTQGDEPADTPPPTPVVPPQAAQRMDDPPGMAGSNAGRNSAMDMIDPSALNSGQNSSDPAGNQTADSPDHNSQDNSSPTGNNPDNSQSENSYDDSHDSASPDNSQDNSSSPGNSQDNSSYNDNNQNSNSSDNSQDNSSSHDASQDNSSSHDDSQDNSNSHDNQSHAEHKTD